MIIGYARVEEDPYDQAEQKVTLRQLGANEVFVDVGETRNGLEHALGRCSAGDELLVTGLSRLAQSLQGLKVILLDMAAAGVDLRIGPTTYNLRQPDQSLTDAVDLMASFEGELAVRRAEMERRAARTARGRRPGRKPKLSPAQERDITRLYEQGVRTVEELANDYGVGTSTIYRILDRATEPATTSAAPQPKKEDSDAIDHR